MGKLVRDRIPDIIRADGGEPVVRVLDEAEYRSALLDKLVEEAEEARGSSPEQLLEELADVYEVLLAICESNGWALDEVVATAGSKANNRGPFHERLYLE